MGAKPSSPSGPEAAAQQQAPQKSLYRRYADAKSGRNASLSDEDVKNCVVGRCWAETRPGVAGNQVAGKIDAGPASGLGGLAAASGYGGWGTDAAGKLKFPPRPRGEGEGKLGGETE
ncbi:hypothetical protein QBC33DRAFT_560313 [Phialemonium atrogriseum]|uniref:Uncharacterized protein n=1 Tax=Phialemonium atrogriseum TaxID=1093897 RepID=A0AAJ0BWQ7_9PEZI|nr:uncharacterized protein QBC33DRAFT_560313 [Phialemonium atrogriseum]KAK1765875.1 hypothetical protein QBC33DRAFT_560313 [Phialemonium atrogriseum]